MPISRAAILATAAAAVLAASPVMAFPQLRGSLSGEYNNYGANGAEANGGRGAANATVNLFETGFGALGVAGDVRYTNLDFNATSLQSWEFGSNAFLRMPFGKFGASVAHARITPSGGAKTKAMSYGAFGEFYATNDLTFSAKGGMFDGTGGFDGAYYGAGAKFYIIPNWSVGARVDQTAFDGGGRLTDYNVSAEYLISWDVPVSLYGGYTYSDTTGPGPHLDLWTIGLKFYFGAGTNDALVAHDRAGAFADPYLPLKSVLAL